MNILSITPWLTAVSIALSLTATSTVAQARFEHKIGVHLNRGLDQTTPLNLNDFASGDIDGDGDLDLIAAADDGPEGLFFNDGTGSFFAGSSRRSFGPHRRVVLGDVDGDGDLDALFGPGGTANYSTGAPLLALNDGHGTFANTFRQIPASAGKTTGLELEDFDGDGDLDIILITDQAGYYWDNDGAGRFTDQTTAAFGTALLGYDLGITIDMNGDGHADLVTSTRAQVEIWASDGAGRFNVLTSAALPAGASMVGDFNSDGTGDLVSQSRIYLNDGSGVRYAVVGNVPISNSRATLIDLNGDGLNELIVDHNEFGTARRLIYTDVGNLQFADQTTAWFETHVTTHDTVPEPFFCHAAIDVDQDGNPDLLTGGARTIFSSTTVGIPPSLHLNTGSAPLVDAARPRIPFEPLSAAILAAADVDGDGDIDLFASDYVSQLWLQNPDGWFERGGNLPVVDGNAGAFADVDGDGDVDFVSAHGWDVRNPHTANTRLALNDGTGQFVDVTGSHMPRLPISGAVLAIGDVDLDGDVDVVIGTRAAFQGPGQQDVLLLNDGQGQFSDSTAGLPTRLVDTRAIMLVDFDGDSDLDLMLQDGLGQPTPQLLFYANDGAGGFIDRTSGGRPPFAPPFGVDLDEDGSVDPIAAFSSGISIGAQNFPWGHRSYDMRYLPVDVDRDGDLDLFLGSVEDPFGGPTNSNHVGVLYNLHRDVDVNSLPRLGQHYRLRFRASNGPGGATTVLPAVATALTARPVVVPALGEFVLDLATTVSVQPIIVPNATTPGELSFGIPAVTALAGMRLASQALFIPHGGQRPPRLSNFTIHTIRQ